MNDWPLLLAANAGAQILFAILLGWLMLLPARGLKQDLSITVSSELPASTGSC